MQGKKHLNISERNFKREFQLKALVDSAHLYEDLEFLETVSEIVFWSLSSDEIL